MSKRPTPPPLVAELRRRLEAWRDQLNASKRVACWVDCEEIAGAWSLKITIYTRAGRRPGCDEAGGGPDGAETNR